MPTCNVLNYPDGDDDAMKEKEKLRSTQIITNFIEAIVAP